MTVTPEEIEAFRRDGAVCLRGLVTPEWLAVLNAGVDRNIADPGPLFADFTRPGDDKRCIKEYWSWERIPEYQDFFRNGPAAAAAGELLQCREIRWLEDQYFQKEAGARTPSPWHQDQPYYEVAGDWIAMWIALDAGAPEDSLQFVAGSHLDGQLYTPKNFSESAAYHVDEDNSPLKPVPDVDAHPDQYRVIGWDVRPGDALCFHPRTIHGNKGNSGGGRVRRFVARWVSESATYDAGVFPWATMISGHGLTKGEPFHGPKFPLVWTRENGLIARSTAERAA
jgi:ectoine hydroxylase-related dioxygenase (phytanoyl-CoA dioxygenase family)